MSFPVIEGPRVRLRALRPGDEGVIFAYRSHPDVARYQGWDVDYSLDDATKLVAGMSAAEPGERGAWYQVGIALCTDDVLLGDFGVHFEKEDPGAVEFGYTLGLDHQGKGYASEALRLLLDTLAGSFGIQRFKAVTDVRNLPSRRLLARLGFDERAAPELGGVYKGEWCDVVECRLQRERKE